MYHQLEIMKLVLYQTCIHTVPAVLKCTTGGQLYVYISQSHSWLGSIFVWSHSEHWVPGYGAAGVHEAVSTRTKVTMRFLAFHTSIQFFERETLSLLISHYSTHRYCKSTIQVGDIIIPEGAQVLVPIYLLHHMPEYWPDPKRFDPERYIHVCVYVDMCSTKDLRMCLQYSRS